MRSPSPAPDVVDAALLEYMPDSPRASAENSARPRRNPTLRNSIPGNRVSPWRSRWRPPCAGPRKPQENPSLTLRPRVPAPRRPRYHRHAANRRQIGITWERQAQPPRQPGPRKFRRPMPRSLGLEPTASANHAFLVDLQNRQRSRRSRTHRRAMAGIRARAPATAAAPSFSSLDDGQQASGGGQQEDPADRGPAARTRGRGLFRLDENAVWRAAAIGAAIGRSRHFGNGCAASTAGGRPRSSNPRLANGVPQPRNRTWGHKRCSGFVQAFSCSGRGRCLEQDFSASQGDSRGR